MKSGVVQMRKMNNSVIVAGSQLTGGSKLKQDYLGNYNDECIVIADGAGDAAHGDVAATLAGETAIWGYKHIRQRPFYWADKRLLLRRIFRSSNITVWQKRREKGFETGLGASLAMVIIGGYKFWVGTAGNTRVLLYREGLIDVLTPPDACMLGVKRFGLIPHVVVEKLLPRDIILLVTEGVLNFLDEDQLRATFEVTGDTEESIMNAVTHILRTAEENGSHGSLTACMIKRIRHDE
jgi:serine/threonine protein phosphatase PrpC